MQAQEVLSQSSFYSVNDLRLHFGLGERTKRTWKFAGPTAPSERVSKVPADRLITIREGVGHHQD